jgi:hypothetical protein
MRKYVIFLALSIFILDFFLKNKGPPRTFDYFDYS